MSSSPPSGCRGSCPRLLDLYGDGAVRAVAADPYALVMRGADFAQADRLAAIVGPAPSAPAVGRPEAAVHAALRANERRGGSCLAVGDLLADASRLLRGVVDTAVLDVACREKRIVCAGGLVWSVRAHAIEARVAVNLTRLSRTAAPWHGRRRPRVDRCHAVAGAGGREGVPRRGVAVRRRGRDRQDPCDRRARRDRGAVRQARGAVRADRARRTQPRGRDGDGGQHGASPRRLDGRRRRRQHEHAGAVGGGPRDRRRGVAAWTSTCS